MTDSRSKTKANSIAVLNRQRRGNDSINAMFMINDDTDVSDEQMVVNVTGVGMTAQNVLKSPWKDEMKSRSDESSNDTEEDLNVPPSISVRPNINIKRKSTTTGRIAKKNSINKNMSLTERSIERSSKSQWVKFSEKKKSQKYHWSGKFHARTNPFPEDTAAELYENNHLMNYNYNGKDFEEKKATNKENIFYSNKLDPQTNYDLRKDEQIDDNIYLRSYTIDTCTNEFDKVDHSKDHDTEQDNVASPAILSDFNVTLRRRIKNIDKNETYDINKENNLSNVKEFDFSKNIKLKIINPEKQSTIRPYCYKVWRLLLSFLKNVILFSLLPAAYIMFFLYLQGMENKTQNDI